MRWILLPWILLWPAWLESSHWVFFYKVCSPTYWPFERKYRGIRPNLKGLRFYWWGSKFSGRCLKSCWSDYSSLYSSVELFRIIVHSNSNHLPGIVLWFHANDWGCPIWLAVHWLWSLEGLFHFEIPLSLSVCYYLCRLFLWFCIVGNIKMEVIKNLLLVLYFRFNLPTHHVT